MISLLQFLDLQTSEMNRLTLLNELIRHRLNGETGYMLSRLFPSSVDVILATIHLNFVYQNLDID